MYDREVHEGEHYTKCVGCGTFFPLRNGSEEDEYDRHIAECFDEEEL